MTAAELLKPRFEVIAEYPNCTFKKGTILIEWTLKDWFIDESNINSDVTKLAFTVPYPHLYKQLNWWEKRTVDEMPKKVVSTFPRNKGEILFVERWRLDIDNPIVEFSPSNTKYSLISMWDSEKCYLPKD